MHVVLYQPEIPPNVGNVARQCVGMDATLHIVGPHALDFSSSRVRRAGLDYWEHVDVQTYASWADFTRREPQGQRLLFTKSPRLCVQ